MGKATVIVARVVGMLALLIGLASVAFGVLLIVGSGGSSGFGAAIGLGLGILLLGAAAALIVPGLLLYRAARVLSAGGPELPAATRQSRLVSNGAILIAGLAWLAAVVVDALDRSIEPVVFALNAGGAVLCVATAMTARYLPGRPLGKGLLAIALLGAGIATWEARATLDAMNRAAAFAAEQERYQERFEPILTGPNAGDVQEAVGRVGTWMPVTGGTFPYQMGDEWPNAPKDALAELNGKLARFAILGQCWVEGGEGRLVPELRLAVGRDAQGSLTHSQVTLPAVPCDGEIHAAISEAVALPDFLRTSSPPEERRAWLLAGAAVSGDRKVDGDTHAERWLVFVSPDPPSDPAVVRDAVDGVIGPLTLN